MKRFCYILLLYLVVNSNIDAQLKDIDISNITLNSQRFNWIANMCLDTVVASEQKLNIINKFEVCKDFTEPRIVNDFVGNNSFPIKAYLNFDLKDIKFGAMDDTLSMIKTESIKLYFDWPIIELASKNIILRIKFYSEKFLTEYFFKIAEDDNSLYIKDFSTAISMPHVPLQVLSFDMENKESGKIDSLRNKQLMKKIKKGIQNLPEKKDKSI
ncbi:MAG: hypothetical protein P1U56_20255 [Saprospiraceae bacterium]|nr:hypothetical protein [Saprospiraceae bacterium]